eukprot:TRINITY_DN5163_c0_g1_i1.p1 TRINITY_DN5163_c0_g1~~TRINITY_DN5163_c0_g1_i1.p1  ORF type:complete len:156 (+),score=0.01 TRINITY_DN5163_c0_g1_i1:30-470(+)
MAQPGILSFPCVPMSAPRGVVLVLKTQMLKEALRALRDYNNDALGVGPSNKTLLGVPTSPAVAPRAFGPDTAVPQITSAASAPDVMVHDPYSFHGPRYITGPSVAKELTNPIALPSRRRNRASARKPRPPRTGTARVDVARIGSTC